MSDGKVSTRHAGANGAIERLREAAAVLQTLGDEHVDLTERFDSLCDRHSSLEVELAGQKDMATQLDDWTDLLHNFRQGLVDGDELIERTVGRP